MKIEIGNYYYYYSDGIGVIKLRCTHHNLKLMRYEFINNDNLPIYFIYDNLDIIHEDENHAFIDYYKKQQEVLNDNIEFLNGKIKVYQEQLNDINESILKLKDKYPEEFV